MKPEIIVIGILAIAFLVYQVIINKKRKKQQVMQVIKSSWGDIPDREYTAEEFEAISHYFKTKKDNQKFTIDDITWNDLDMDSVFLLLNNTQSSAGAEYLYNMLRTPCFESETLRERDKMAEFFENNEETRLKLQYIFRYIGHTKKIALVDYIYSLASLSENSNLPHHLGNLALLFSIGILAFFPPIGILLLSLTVITNMMSYYKMKATIESYFICVTYIVRLVEASNAIEKFTEPELKPYGERLKAASKPLESLIVNSKYLGSTDKVSGSIADMIMDYVRMITHLDLIKFNSMLSHVKKHIDKVDIMIEEIGKLESDVAIASYRHRLPIYTKPILVNDKKVHVNVNNIYHPLIQNPVANSIDETKCVLLTGSNASGKSTFLKTIAINAVLAQSIYTVLAEKYETNFFKIYSSMALKDDLKAKESYYIVEIKSLKRILDDKAEDAPILCFIDEVLRGTNTVERIAASSRILQSLSQRNDMVFAATHDIELTHMLEKEYSNYHFKEEVVDDDVLFNYVLYRGRATTRNAIKLLSVMGYDKDVIQKADSTAKRFLEDGVWSM